MCEKLIPFQALPRQLWLQFADKEAYDQKQELVMNALRSWEGQDQVVIYLAKERAKKVLPANWRVSCDAELLRNLYQILSEKNVRVVQKSIESIRKMN